MKDAFCPRSNTCLQPSKDTLNKCVCQASQLDPCLCPYLSLTDTIIDIYIVNTTCCAFKLSESDIQVGTGPFTTFEKGFWVVEPPEIIKPNETIFIRGWSGCVDTEDPPNFIYRALFKIKLVYRLFIEKESSVENHPPPFFQIFIVRERGPSSTPVLFEPITVVDFDTSTTKLQLYHLRPPNVSVEWQSTAEFILSQKTKK